MNEWIAQGDVTKVAGAFTLVEFTGDTNVLWFGARLHAHDAEARVRDGGGLVDFVAGDFEDGECANVVLAHGSELNGGNDGVHFLESKKKVSGGIIFARFGALVVLNLSGFLAR